MVFLDVLHYHLCLLVSNHNYIACYMNIKVIELVEKEILVVSCLLVLSEKGFLF